MGLYFTGVLGTGPVMPDPLVHSLLSGISLFAGFSSVSAFAFSKDIYALKKKKKKNRKEKKKDCVTPSTEI